MARGVSLRALQWLERVAQSDVCVWRGTRYPIQHAYSPKGKKFYLRLILSQGEYVVDGRWRVDGYVDFGPGRKPLFLEYNGCYWHMCERCGGRGGSALNPTQDGPRTLSAQEKERFRSERDGKKLARLKQLGRLIIQRECEVRCLRCDFHEREIISTIPP